MLESKVKDKIKKLLKAYGVYYFMPQGGYFGNIGVPDFVCCYHGLFLAIEAKAGDNQPTARQLEHINNIKNHGGRCLVINENNLKSLEDLLNVL